MRRPEFQPKAMPKTPLTSLAWEELARFGVGSIYEPLMGTGSSLYEFKRQGVRVVGSEWLEGAYWGSKALTENNSTRLSPAEMARFTPDTPPRLERHPRFAAWVERGFFDEPQAAWLGYWRDQFESVSDYPSGLLALAVRWVMNNWLDRAEVGQSSLEGGTAIGFYMKRVNQWIWDNGQANLALLGDSVALAQGVEADACYLYLPPPQVAVSMRDWLLEAWWQGIPVADLKAFYDGNPFYSTLEEYQGAVTTLFENLDHIPLWVVQYRCEELDALWGEQPSWLADRDLIAQQHLGMGGGASAERLMLAKRKSS